MIWKISDISNEQDRLVTTPRYVYMLPWLWFKKFHFINMVHNIDQYVITNLFAFSCFIKTTNNHIFNQGYHKEQYSHSGFGAYLVQHYVYCIIFLIVAFYYKCVLYWQYFVNLFLIAFIYHCRSILIFWSHNLSSCQV